jgi:type IV pilus assembly protein PilA
VKQQQAGFTLIELMIVVAIIGILAAIALPQYQNFMARGQASESVVLLGGAQTSIEDYAVDKGNFVGPDTTFTATSEAAAVGNATVAGLGVTVVGKYGVISTTANTADNGDGSVAYQFYNAGVNTSIKDKIVTYHRDSAGKWSCSTTLAAAFKPKGCS